MKLLSIVCNQRSFVFGSANALIARSKRTVRKKENLVELANTKGTAIAMTTTISVPVIGTVGTAVAQQSKKLTAKR